MKSVLVNLKKVNILKEWRGFDRIKGNPENPGIFLGQKVRTSGFFS